MNGTQQGAGAGLSLHQVASRPAAQRADRQPLVRRGGHDHDWHIGRLGPDGPQSFQPGASRRAKLQQDQVDGSLGEALKSHREPVDPLRPDSTFAML